MDFFQAQDDARRSTLWLVLLFALAVLGLILLTNLFVLAFVLYAHGDVGLLNLKDVLRHYGSGASVLVGLGVAGLVGLGSLFRMVQLAAGGAVVAESLGGRVLPGDSEGLDERKVLNVVEEMAIASGMPVPTVYLLDDGAINAFAAGWTPSDAVIGITRGAIRQLDRDELQGVVAHEFSHILNGDMRLNIRLVGVLAGILLIGEIGQFILRTLRRAPLAGGRRKGAAIPALFVLGLGLWVIGYAGTFFGTWIKALVSRQREFLADASAVQFTRNRAGISGALKKIGGSMAGSLLSSPMAPQFSHAYFARGVSGGLQSLFASHPPLEDRIRRILPRWDGRFIAPPPPPPVPEESESAAGKQVRERGRRRAVLTGVLAGTLGDLVAQTGQPDAAQQTYAHDLIAGLPPQLREASGNPQTARAVVYALLLDGDADVLARQWQTLDGKADDGVADLTRRYLPAAAGLERAQRLPLVELSLPSLRGLSPQQYARFRGVLNELMAADGRISLWEWVVRHLVLRGLDLHFALRKPARQTYYVLGSAKAACETVLSLIALAEHADPSEAQRAFAAGRHAVGAGALRFVPRDELDLNRLDGAMDELEKLKPPLKRRFLDACAACIAMDGDVTVGGAELLRTVAAALDCPMPPPLPLA